MIRGTGWRAPRALAAGLWCTAGLSVAATLSGCNANNGGGATGATGTTGAAADGTVATVNGDNITRTELHNFLEATGGETALRQLIEFQLLMQELKKRGLDVTEAEVDQAMAERRQQNPAISAEYDRLSKEGPLRESLRRSIRYDLAVAKVLTNDIKVNDAQFKAWLAKNRDRYARVKLGLLITSSKVRADTMAQQLKNKTKTFAQLVDEQKKARDAAAASSTAESPFLPVDSLPPAMRAQVAKLQPGATSPALTLAAPPQSPQKIFAVVRLADRQDATEQDYKLEQVARNTAKETPGSPNFEQVLKQVEQSLMQQNMQQGRMERPSHRDLITAINQGALQKLTTQLRENVKVENIDPMYARLAEAYKPAPAATGAGGAPGAGGAATPGGAPSAPGASTPNAASSSPAGAPAGDAAPAGAPAPAGNGAGG